ncbi:MAG: hypothetical protein LBE33_06335 [Zoogloeaceae bacterium]|jgi:hypothetical protein|nr:hypothetical protein [Zoogloeaceae bacterium]
MTAQIDDFFRYRKRKYAVAGISEGELFDPAWLGLSPVGSCSACWRGYQAVFAISGSRLMLDTLDVELREPDQGPPINGVQPDGSCRAWFNNHYKRLNYPLQYTGGLLLAAGFIRDLYEHMGFHPAWKYEKVVELVFDDGILIDESDRSEQIAAIRQKGTTSEPMSDENGIVAFIERAFDRSY